MKVVTPEQMRRIDETTIRERGIPGAVLMDRAGKAVAREAMERFEPDSVIVVTGKGNNAGDGFVVARELHRHGIPVTLCMLRPAGEISGTALDMLNQVPAEVRRLDQPGPAVLREELTRHDLAVDAIFGTGLSGSPRAPWDEYIQAINACRMNVLAVDIPSGLPGEGPAGGGQSGPWVRATMTVTMGLPKLAMVMDPGVRATGRVVVADIGFPRDLLEDEAIQTNLMTMEQAERLLPNRQPGGHKGTFGRVMLLAGSEGMTGSAVLAAKAAARSGAGLIYSAYPHVLGTIMESHLIEPVKIPLAGEEGWLTGAQAGAVIEAAETMQALAIGPGIGRRPETGRLLSEVVARVKAPLVIDADGLNLLAENLEALAGRPGPTVLTPHPGEAARLLGYSIDEVENNRLDAMAELSKRYGAVVVLKGAQTVTTEPNGQRTLNPTGNSGLAKGGSGDVLTGLITGLLAQGCAPGEAARLGVFLHGMAADVAAEKNSPRGMLPSDVIEALGTAFQRLERSAGRI